MKDKDYRSGTGISGLNFPFLQYLTEITKITITGMTL